MLNFIQAKFKAAAVRLHAWWQSETSTFVGLVAAAAGTVTQLTTLFNDSAVTGALHDLGLAEAWIRHIASALIVAGAVLITPKKKDAQ